MALIDRRFKVRLQNIPRGECLDEEGLCMLKMKVMKLPKEALLKC